MDRLTIGFPRTSSNCDVVWVTMDRLAKYAHFLVIKTTNSTVKLAWLYVEEIVQLHGVPPSVVLDKDPHFTSHMWDSFQEALDSSLYFSTGYHPIIDG